MMVKSILSYIEQYHKSQSLQHTTPSVLRPSGRIRKNFPKNPLTGKKWKKPQEEQQRRDIKYNLSAHQDASVCVLSLCAAIELRGQLGLIWEVLSWNRDLLVALRRITRVCYSTFNTHQGVEPKDRQPVDIAEAGLSRPEVKQLITVKVLCFFLSLHSVRIVNTDRWLRQVAAGLDRSLQVLADRSIHLWLSQFFICCI